MERIRQDLIGSLWASRGGSFLASAEVFLGVTDFLANICSSYVGSIMPNATSSPHPPPASGSGSPHQIPLPSAPSPPPRPPTLSEGVARDFAEADRATPRYIKIFSMSRDLIAYPRMTSAWGCHSSSRGVPKMGRPPREVRKA